jgi:hypothetical protein
LPQTAAVSELTVGVAGFRRSKYARTPASGTSHRPATCLGGPSSPRMTSLWAACHGKPSNTAAWGRVISSVTTGPLGSCLSMLRAGCALARSRGYVDNITCRENSTGQDLKVGFYWKGFVLFKCILAALHPHFVGIATTQHQKARCKWLHATVACNKRYLTTTWVAQVRQLLHRYGPVASALHGWEPCESRKRRALITRARV